MGAMASQITSITIVYSTVYSGADQRKHQSSASLAFVPGIHRWPVNSPHKGPVTRKMFPFDDVIMIWYHFSGKLQCVLFPYHFNIKPGVLRLAPKIDAGMEGISTCESWAKFLSAYLWGPQRTVISGACCWEPPHSECRGCSVHRSHEGLSPHRYCNRKHRVNEMKD